MNILLVDDERLAVEVMNRMIDKEKITVFSTIYKALSMKTGTADLRGDGY